MGPAARREYAADMRTRYAAAGRAARSALLDAFVAATGYHRKYAIALLGGPAHAASRKRRVGGWRCSSEAVASLVLVWRSADYPWSVRLKAMLPLWVPALRARGALTVLAAAELVALSPRTIDRVLQQYRGQERRRLYGRTKPGLLLKHQVPIRSERWDEAIEPGWVEVDTVSHSGPVAAGEFAHTVNASDIGSCWTESRAVQGKSQRHVVEALEQIRSALPFALKGLDSDSGAEFINANVVRWCQANKIAFTRSRPYHKNDNAHVEQKNFTHVRRVFGWKRLAGDEIVTAMNHLYSGDLRVWMNCFQPSVKLLSRERVGARVRRRYDAPTTPLDRLLALGRISADRAEVLLAQRAAIDPFELSARIDRAVESILAMTVPPIESPARAGPSPRLANHKAALARRAAAGYPVRIPMARHAPDR